MTVPIDYEFEAGPLSPPVKERGTLRPGELKEVASYYAEVISEIKVDVAAGNTQRKLKLSEFPPSLSRASSKGARTTVIVGNSGLRAVEGSGNPLDDIQHDSWPFSMLCCPLIGIVLVGVAVKMISKATKPPVRRYD